MGSIFGGKPPGPSQSQKDLEASQLREDKRLKAQEDARRASMRRSRSGRSSLISEGNMGRRTLGGE